MKFCSYAIVTCFALVAPTTHAFLAQTTRTPLTFQTSSKRISSSSSSNLGAASSEQQVDCIVVGGGISGSTLAHNINRQSSEKISVLLTEARDYLGGNVKSHRTEDGFLWEEGPNSFATQPSIVRIAHELNIDDQLVFADESLPPWVYHNDKLHPLPKGQGGKGPKGQLELVFGPNGVLKFALFGELLSWPGKIRAGIGAFLGHLPPPENKEETIRDWVERILGEEVFLRCIDPFVSGVYAGDPQTLSMKSALSKINRIEKYAYNIEWNKFGAIFYGGLARQVELTKERKADPPKPEWVEFEYGNPGSFREGLSTLPKAIEKKLGDKVKLSWKLLSIERNENDKDGFQYKCTFDTPDGEQIVHTKAVVSTVPTHALQGSVLENIMPEAVDIMNTIRSDIKRKGVYHPPVAAVTVAYPKSSFKDVELPNGFGSLKNLPGFGSLNPRTEGVRTLGTLWSSSLFPGRCPEDYNLLLNYIGGSRDVGIAELTNDELVGEVDKGCRQVLLKPDAPKPKVVGMKVWPTAIPQYELGHMKLMDELEEIEKDVDGIWICGNYRTGVAFPDCVTFGYEHAKVVIDYLGQQADAVMVENAKEDAAAEVVEEAEEKEIETEEEEVVVDISIPYDAAAKLAYEASDKSVDYSNFKTKYEADAVADVIAKNSPKEAEAEEEEKEEDVVVDISIPYDAAAKLAYEASDKSVDYSDFKEQYVIDAIADVISKQKQEETASL